MHRGQVLLQRDNQLGRLHACMHGAVAELQATVGSYNMWQLVTMIEGWLAGWLLVVGGGDGQALEAGEEGAQGDLLARVVAQGARPETRPQRPHRRTEVGEE